MKSIFILLLYTFLSILILSAQPTGIKWANDGNSLYQIEGGEIVNVALPSNTKTVVVSKRSLTPTDQDIPLAISNFQFSSDYSKVLIFTNTKKVWRYNTRGDYWLLEIGSGNLRQIGSSLPSSSLMFAKFSPDGSNVAYVSNQNIYVEDLGNGEIRALTTEGNRKNIFGTFDWAYEEEFGVRDGFRWSPDGTKIAFWHMDATKIRDIPLINNIDSVAPFVKWVEYPLVGESPSPTRIGVVNVNTGNINWMNIPGDPQQNYLPRMEWALNSKEIIVQQFNRKQNETTIYFCNVDTGSVSPIYNEKNNSFIEVKGQFPGGDITKWDWINNGTSFIWASEKDGWMHLYKISSDGKKEQLLTPGNYDVERISYVDDKNEEIYFIASPDNTLQKALYKIALNGKNKLERVTPTDQPGTHSYNISPNGQFARHSFNNHFIPTCVEYIQLSKHIPIEGTGSIAGRIKESKNAKKIEFFKVTTSEGITLDGWMVKPTQFDPSKKYPVVFFVYGEPATTTVTDTYGVAENFLYRGSMADDGYIYIALDNRGTPSLKGSTWRKSIYRKIGDINIRDQAQGAQEVFKWSFVDTTRTAIWGWSGGANTTLHLLGQYPDLFKTGIAIASVANQLTYDNIYTERYMGLPQENMDDYLKGSPITYVKNIEANLLYVHGSGDDNVHYQNAELLLNEFTKYNKQVQFMAYPNRTHSISEGEGTHLHMSTLYTNFLKLNCPPGGK